ncbi:hypothetical protein [Muriicola sp.]|uniref:hypothetical protein n=1 Tax=Muriicola sp. TaxID=2020856 RepID=UPI003C787512
MKLTLEEIQQLYKFTKAHFVEHYDLQTELVDHLGNGIEEQWNANPDMPFHTALQYEFKKFGVFGFHDVIRDKTKAMEKRYWKILFQFIKDYFKLPKIFMLLILTATVFTLITLLPEGYKGYFIAVTFLFLMVIVFVKSLQNKKGLKKKNRKWLLEDMIMNHTNSLAFLNLGLQICINPFILESLAEYPIGSLLVSFFLVVLMLLFYIMVYIIPPMTEDLLIKTYPEYKMG